MTSTQNAIKIINALKNGVVPDEELEMLCVGRKKELEETQRCLSITRSGAGVVKFLSGKYGSGKSFLLNIIRKQALEQGFIVAKVQIEKGFRFNNLEQLYYHIMHNLSCSNSAYGSTSFENIFDIWIKKLQSTSDRNLVTEEIQKIVSDLTKYNLSFSRAFLTYIRSRISKDTELSNAIASWLTGEKNIPAALKSKFEIVGNIDKVNTIDFFKAFLKLVELMGYSGTVILVDELELIMNERIDIRKTSYENLRYLIDICCSGELNKCMFVFAGTEDFFENTEKGVKTYQALSQRLGDAIDKNNSSLSDMRQPIIRLNTMDRNSFHEITNTVISLYSSIFGFSPNITNESIMSWTLLSCRKLGSKLNEISIRAYLTKLIEILDIMEQHPENTIFKAELKTIVKGDKEIFINDTLKSQKY